MSHDHDPQRTDASEDGTLAPDQSRRRFMGTASAFAIAGAAALGLNQHGTQIATAGGEEVTDIDILNFALSLELLEGEFYSRGFDRFDRCDFERAPFLQEFGALQCRVFDDVAQIRENEEIHAEVLASVIEDLGGEPVEPLEYEFPLDTVEEFVTTARDIENTGVTAYNGTIALIDDSALQTAGATIATVEARHASFLNTITGRVGFPQAFDDTRTIDEVLEIVDQFIVSG